MLGLSSVTALALLGVAWRGTPNASNFEPFAFGVNVVVNASPANPTLWYIGTYVHFVVLGLVVLRYVRVLAGWSHRLFEILVRALLMNRAGDFVAYQVLPNWLTVFVLGVMCGQRPTQQALKPNAARILASVAPLAAMPFLCFIATATVPFHLHFPFMRLDVVQAHAADHVRGRDGALCRLRAARVSCRARVAELGHRAVLLA